MACVVIANLVKIYPDKSGPGVTVVKGIDLDIRDREFMVLVGPSGCGKSTTLRMIAGLEEISGGTITIDGRVVNDVLPKDRDIAMVFQNYALYPHMSVYDNMGFGLKLRKFPKAEIDRRVREAAAMLGLTDYLDRRPKALSGGQRQRVAVGRAIVRQPKVFLFDEPLSNLDAKMRVSTRTELTKLHARLGATIIYVTHDQVEAMTMGDRICVMKDGAIMQVAPPLELYARPANTYVASFIGSPPMNLFRGAIQRRADGVIFAETSPHTQPLVLLLSGLLALKAESRVGQPVFLGIRPEDLSASVSTGDANTAEFTVEISEPMGAETFLHCSTGATTFIARVAPTIKVAAGGKIRLGFDLAKVMLFDGKTENAI